MLRYWRGCPRTSSASPAPSRTLPASGMRRRRCPVGRATSTTGTAGMHPRRAASPRGTIGPIPHGTSASSPARMCGSSHSSTFTSWMSPPTRPSTRGSSAWTQWVSSHPQQTSLPAGLGLWGSSTCPGSRHSLTTRASSSTSCSAAPPATQRCSAAPRRTAAGSAAGTPPDRQTSAPTPPRPGQPQRPQEHGRGEVPHPGAQQTRRHLHGRRLGALVTGSGCRDPPLLWEKQPTLALACPGDIGLCCSTPDLRHMHCKWGWDPAEPHGSHQLFYRPPPSGAGTREDEWQWCEEMSVGAQGTHTCTFQPRAGSAISVLVNVTHSPTLPTRSYFKEPFWLHQAVLTEAPQLTQATVSQGRLSLQWLPPLEALAEQLDYQVRYATENSHDWKVLQVPRAARKEVLDLRPGARYRAQVRAQPSGPWYRGSWSAWSKPVTVDAVADAGWVIPSITVVPLLFTGALLGLRCTFPSLYSKMKQKLWPPVPDLHRALGSFLHESSKHSQVRAQGRGAKRLRPARGQLEAEPSPPVYPQAHAFYKQPPEEAILPCPLEVLPGPLRDAGAPPPEHAAGRLPGTDIANQSYLLMSGWEPRGPPSAALSAPT
ncbi:thrombopoietin receptor isoform X6 [Colius striatus]|uniref:thrombopoietin receptor isoform X6 n=1 Tax=Colius striatus TaxID=57412 RepID=UPI002B1D46A3|nr:thrombopoietin receptor isoform X6 [Colius striatus]